MTITGFTPLNTQHCLLNESRIDLWQFSLEHALSYAPALLNTEERARGDRYHFNHHKRRFYTARAGLRMVLARYLHCAPDKLEFSYNAQGKPSVKNTQKLHFNLSHTGDLALLAVGKGMPMGVDIEQYSLRPFEGIAENQFSEQELREFKKIPACLQMATFFHIWAQKEAFIKACGLGLSYPTQLFTVPTHIPTKQLVDDPLHHTTWQLRSFMPQIACSGALCYHPLIREIRYGVVDLQSSGL